MLHGHKELWQLEDATWRRGIYILNFSPAVQHIVWFEPAEGKVKWNLPRWKLKLICDGTYLLFSLLHNMLSVSYIWFSVIMYPSNTWSSYCFSCCCPLWLITCCPWVTLVFQLFCNVAKLVSFISQLCYISLSIGPMKINSTTTSICSYM
jgi:cellulose synthase/poly-beta-1,6-N-acetylglucosamine synthase-like glycosyltransferase